MKRTLFILKVPGTMSQHHRPKEIYNLCTENLENVALIYLNFTLNFPSSSFRSYKAGDPKSPMEILNDPRFKFEL